MKEKEVSSSHTLNPAWGEPADGNPSRDRICHQGLSSPSPIPFLLPGENKPRQQGHPLSPTQVLRGSPYTAPGAVLSPVDFVLSLEIHPLLWLPAGSGPQSSILSRGSSSLCFLPGDPTRHKAESAPG